MLQKAYNIYKDSLILNSMIIILTNIINAGSGFLFWIIATNIFNSYYIGISIAIISSVGLVNNFSLLGLNFGLTRYISKVQKKNIFISTIIILTSFINIIVFSIYIIINILLKSSTFHNISIFYLLIIIIYSMLNLLLIEFTNIFVSIKKAYYSLLINIIFNFRIIFLLIFIKFQNIGIILSFEVSLIIVSIISYYLLKNKKILLKPVIVMQYIKIIVSYSIKNHITNLLMNLYVFLIPIYVINIIGSKETAYYYIAYTIGTFLNIIPQSIFTSLFVEGSHDSKNLLILLRKSLKLLFITYIPILLILFLFSKEILKVYSLEYAKNSLILLRFILISTLFMIVINLFITYYRIIKNTKNLLRISFIYFSILNISTIILLFFTKNINNIGISFLFTNIFVSLILIIYYVSKKKR